MMAAPSGIVWGSAVNNKGRLGIYTSVSSTNTQSTVSIEVWLWTRASTVDSGNTFYFDNEKTSATTSKGSVSINHKVNTSWSTSNQTRLGLYTYTYDRGTVAKTVYCAAKLVNIDWVGAQMTFSASYTIPALPSYSVTYNANSGSGAPSNQTKWYGKALTLSGTKPTRTGYAFQGWATSASSQTVSYAAGSTYTGNAGLSLYAVWKANTYTVTYNANGGTGAPANQTKTYGVNLTLSNTKPTRKNYNFLGWGASASSKTASFASGSVYSANAPITLYAVWELAYSEPEISSISVGRCIADGTLDDYGSHAKVAFSWSCDQTQGANTVASVLIKHKAASSVEWTTTTASASGISGNINQIIGDGAIDVDTTYLVEISVKDGKNGTTTITRTIGAAKFPIDFLSGGSGASFGKPSSVENVIDVNADWDILSNSFYPVRRKHNIRTASDPAVDFNSFTAPGVYTWANTNNFRACSNIPSSAAVAGSLTVDAILGTQTYLIQMYKDLRNNEWHRQSENGGETWSAWCKHINEGELSDYVVETGYSNFWRWRKWESGFAECWYEGYTSAKSVTFQWGSIYTGNAANIHSMPYPIAFAENPDCIISNTNASIGNQWLIPYSNGSLTQTPSWQLARGTSGTSQGCDYLLYVCGKWK